MDILNGGFFIFILGFSPEQYFKLSIL